jgi:serine/threonine protein kinase
VLPCRVADSTTPDPRVGRVLQGRYRIVEPLGSGGMGVVYRGERVGLGRTVAVKFVWAAAAQDDQVRKRFEIEAQAMSRLTHRTCVGVIDFGVDEGSPYLVMDFAKGQTLRARLDAGAIPAAEALHVARQILGGLAHAHEQGITHRDIKPDNIILTEASGFDTEVRILDFGLAKLKDVSSALSTGFALGTPRYMSPEQTVGGAVDARSDLYAVGVLLFEMLTGETPFVSDQYIEVLRMHRELAAPALRERGSGATFSPALEAAVARVLKKSPEARFASAAAFAAALEATPEADAPVTAPPVERAQRTTAVGKKVTPLAVAPTLASAPALPAARRPLRYWPVLAAALPLIAVAVWLVVREPSRAPDPTPAPTPSAEATKAPQPTPDPVPVPVPPPAMREEIAGLDQARALVRGGRAGTALEALRKLRARNPKDAEIHYLMGRAYFDKLWWNDGFEAYHAAIALDPSYRTDRDLITDVLKSLVSDRYGAAGARFVEREIGAAAVPYVEDLTRSKSVNIQKRATRLLPRLGAKR